MADYSCDFCNENEICKYAYDELDCKIQMIKEAKIISNKEFEDFYKKYSKLNEDICNDELASILSHMYNIILLSKQN